MVQGWLCGQTPYFLLKRMPASQANQCVMHGLTLAAWLPPGPLLRVTLEEMEVDWFSPEENRPETARNRLDHTTS